MKGIINVLKPPGMTSHDVVYFIRKALKTKKVGHTGTLDPEAAGVLPICVGKATKAGQYLTDKHKKYRANIKFGISTDTYDKYGEIIKTKNPGVIDSNTLEAAIEGFRGIIKQKPPLYSAVKVKGKKLYQYARQGEEVEVKERTVEIFEFKVVGMIAPDEAMADITCSKGTYIRSLCNDIGEKLGCGAHMSQLVRLSSEPFSIENARTLEEIESCVLENRIEEIIEPVEIVFNNYKKIHIKTSALKSVLNGSLLYSQGIIEDMDTLSEGTAVSIYSTEGFIGIGQVCVDEESKRKYIRVENKFV
jgi:tRNA pseudouridine55 synthase